MMPEAVPNLTYTFQIAKAKTHILLNFKGSTELEYISKPANQTTSNQNTKM